MRVVIYMDVKRDLKGPLGMYNNLIISNLKDSKFIRDEIKREETVVKLANLRN